MPSWFKLYLIGQVQPVLRSKRVRPTTVVLGLLFLVPMAAPCLRIRVKASRNHGSRSCANWIRRRARKFGIVWECFRFCSFDAAPSRHRRGKQAVSGVHIHCLAHPILVPTKYRNGSRSVGLGASSYQCRLRHVIYVDDFCELVKQHGRGRGGSAPHL